MKTELEFLPVDSETRLNKKRLLFDGSAPTPLKGETNIGGRKYQIAERSFELMAESIEGFLSLHGTKAAEHSLI